MANERLHSPIELWASRSVFGNRLNDGEIRPDITLNFEKKLPSYTSIKEEINNWHAAYYSPLLLSSEETKSLGLLGLDSRWKGHIILTPTDWYMTVHRTDTDRSPTVEFTILLPGFVLSKSEWRATLSSVNGKQEMTVFPTDPECYLTSAGLVLNFKNAIRAHANATLTVIYHPALGLDDEAHPTAQFTIEK
jgi:hypothetical protein